MKQDIFYYSQTTWSHISDLNWKLCFILLYTYIHATKTIENILTHNQSIECKVQFR